MKLYVGNLNYNADEPAIEEMFRAHGEVTSVKLITDRETGRSRGFAFVEMPSKEEALSAMEAIGDQMVDGRRLVVNEARPQTKRY